MGNSKTKRGFPSQSKISRRCLSQMSQCGSNGILRKCPSLVQCIFSPLPNSNSNLFFSSKLFVFICVFCYIWPSSLYFVLKAIVWRMCGHYLYLCHSQRLPQSINLLWLTTTFLTLYSSTSLSKWLSTFWCFISFRFILLLEIGGNVWHVYISTMRMANKQVICWLIIYFSWTSYVLMLLIWFAILHTVKI